ncbi:MAG: hypothetical protein K9M82_01775 [Deltaproteobacteria bacterium]|nr:hypothetical protein [Deltaproteobacteria bacterium]
MSWSNVIKKGEEIQFNIHSYEAESLVREDEDPASQPRPSTGALVLPGGPLPRSKDGNGHEETESAEERLARLEREAYEKGFEQGRKDGLELETKQIEEQRHQMEALFSELRGLKSSLFREAEQEAVTLSVRIAKRILREEIRTDPAVIHRTVRAALDFVTDRSRLAITVHPEDMEEIRKILPELASMTEGGRFQVKEDEAVDRGGCVLETGFGTIRATISEQLAVIDKVIDQAFAAGKGDEP